MNIKMFNRKGVSKLDRRRVEITKDARKTLQQVRQRVKERGGYAAARHFERFMKKASKDRHWTKEEMHAALQETVGADNDFSIRDAKDIAREVGLGEVAKRFRRFEKPEKKGDEGGREQLQKEYHAFPENSDDGNNNNSEDKSGAVSSGSPRPKNIWEIIDKGKYTRR